MPLTENDKVSINTFMGLYQRGLSDDCPPDHSPTCQNMRFNRNGEASTRDGTIPSFTLTTSISRMAVATFGNDVNILLTCDGAGKIYRSDTGGVLLTVSNMVDFRIGNIFNFCLISPILSSPASSNPVYIWQATTGGTDVIAIRPAAGQPPSGSFTAAETSGGGNCDIGVHQFAVSFITNSGYTTIPGPYSGAWPGGTFTAVTVNSTGGNEIALSGIPTGPSGTIARQIFTTQADLDLFYYCPGGYIADNTTTSLTVNFYDTDLAVSADSLFDLIPVIPGGTYGEAGGILFYHDRTFYFGGEFDLIRASNPGDCESIDNVAGYVQLPTQNDGNIVRGACVLYDVLYFTKGFGILSVIDNGGDPATWAVALVDGGVGATMDGLGTINLSQTGQSQNNIILLGDFGGIYGFSGAVQQPPLTWKINDLWTTIVNTINIQTALTISIDPYNKIIYVLPKGMSFILAGDYNNGLDSKNIKWSKYVFPYTPTAIGMAYITDINNEEYLFRIGTNGSGVFVLTPGTTQDNGIAINSFISTYYVGYDIGSVNIFRFLRTRTVGSGTLIRTLYSQDNVLTQSPPTVALTATNSQDQTVEFNFMTEKCSVQLQTNSGTDNFTVQRIDLWGKSRFMMRPTV